MSDYGAPHLRPSGYGGQAHGRARVLGDDVNTDYIISSSRKRATIDPKQLAPYLLEGVSPDFAVSVRPGDILVAGRNFGCGSAMEVAVTVIQAAGIQAVVARSFARSFFRNAINNGLLAVECETGALREGDEIVIELSDLGVAVRDVTSGAIVSAAPLPQIVRELIRHGGLVPYLAARGSF